MTVKSNTQPKPVLLFGYGNLSRGDDALGPLLLEHVETQCDLTEVELLVDFQLQIEHALDLQHRRLVLFADASVNSDRVFDFIRLEPLRDKSYTTHAMSPAAVLQVYQSITQQSPPPCFLLTIKAEQFELGNELSDSAKENLKLGCQFTERLLSQPSLEYWMEQVRS